jgi:predicted Zn finger-like uncharacterized protein
MNVACPQCPAKYAVTDDKVRGRKVRIKCKRCGSPIIVDGTQFAVPPTAPKEEIRPRQKTMLGGLHASPDLLSSFGSQGKGRAAKEEAPRSARAPASAPAPSFKPASEPAPVSAQVISRPAGSATSLRALESKDEKSILWSVAISETDVREMPAEEIVGAYAAGLIDQYTYIWRDTMTEWLVPFDVPEIAKLLRARGFNEQPPPPPAPASPLSRDAANDAHDSEANREWRELLAKPHEEPKPLPGAKFDDVTVVMTAEQIEAAHDSLSSLQIQRGEFQSLEVTPTDHNVSWPPEVPQAPDAPISAPAEERLQAAKSEAAESVVTEPDASEPVPEEPAESLPAEEAEPVASSQIFALAADDDAAPASGFEEVKSEPTPDSGLTGARNESSVLFSLRALVQTEETHERVTEDSLVGGASGVPSLALGQSSEGGVLESALVQAVSQPPSAIPPGAAPEKGSGKLALLIVVIVLLAIAAIAYVFLGQGAPPPSAPSSSLSSEPAAVAPPKVTPPPERTEPAQSAPTMPSATATGAAPEASAAPSAQPSASQQAPSAASVAPTTQPSPAARPAPAAPAPVPAHEEPAPSASAEPEPPPAPPFNTESAKGALAVAAASASINCKAADGPKGNGKVTVIFAPSGKATQALVSGDFAGTNTGGCIARIFKEAHVPPFSGSSVSVSKSVTIR